METNQNNLPFADSKMKLATTIASRRRRLLEDNNTTGADISKMAYQAKKQSEDGTGYEKTTTTERAEMRRRLKEIGDRESIMATIDNDIAEEFRDGLELDYNSTNRQASDAMRRQDFRPLFGLEDQPRLTRFDCHFIPGATAWLSTDNLTGVQRYFSQTPEGKVHGFDIFDLLEIVEGYRYNHALSYLSQSLGVKYAEGEWMRMQEIKYLQNISYIENASRQMASEAPKLYKFAKRAFPVLSKMINIGQSNIYGKRYSNDDEAMFYSSQSFIAQRPIDDSKPPSRSMASRYINLLAVLGLVKKVSKTEVLKTAPELVSASTLLAGSNAQFKIVSFYTIPLYDIDVIKQAEDRVALLKANKITPTNINKDTVLQVFGVEFASTIYDEDDLPDGDVYIVEAEEIDLAELLPY